MRVLWITNQPIGAATKKYGTGTSGTWMDPTLYEMHQASVEIYLGVAFVSDVKSAESFVEEGIHYYALPRDPKKIYPYNDKKHRSEWKSVITDMNPDLIMIWGTEYAHGLCALLEAKGVPSVIVIQGILESVSRYYCGEMNISDIKSNYTFRSFIKHDSILNAQKLYKKKSQYELEMYQISQNVILENKWAEAYIKAKVPSVNSYYYKLKIKDLFYEPEWNLDACDRESILCTAPGQYPLKGFHLLLEALAIIKRKYPNVILRVPGMKSPFGCSVMERIKRSDYVQYVLEIIDRNELRNNIEFLGDISSQRMAQELKRTHVFVVPSTIENQSMSLREAMAVGTPCVASAVGGIPESVTNGDDCLAFRSGEYEYMAECIMDIFSTDDKAKHISKSARNRIRDYYSDHADTKTLIDIYKKILYR